MTMMNASLLVTDYIMSTTLIAMTSVITGLHHRTENSTTAGGGGEGGGEGVVTPSSFTISQDDDEFESRVAVIVPIAFGAIALFGVIGNVVVVVVIAVNHGHRQQPKNMTNALIVSLAVADLLFIVVCVPFTAVRYALNVWTFGVAWCKIYHYVANVTAYASVYTLVLMSLDRFLAVVYPIESITVRTYRNTFAAIGLNWAFFAAINLHIWWEYEPSDYSYHGQVRSECMNTRIFAQEEQAEKKHARLVYGCFFAFAYVLPLGVICVLYGCILRKMASRHAVPGVRRESAERVRSRRRMTRMVVVIVLVFSVCWLPIHVVYIIRYYGNAGVTKSLVSLQAIGNCFAYLNSCVNPFLYAFLSDSFRGWFHRLLDPNPAVLGAQRRGQARATVAVADRQRPIEQPRKYEDCLQSTFAQQTTTQPSARS